MKYLPVVLLFFIHISVFAQSTKMPLDHDAYDIWNTIKNVQITNDGKWSTYQVQPGMGDPTVKLIDENGMEQASFQRSKNAIFSWSSDYLIFKISAPLDTIKAMRRRKVEKEDLPKDTLGILNLRDNELIKIPNVKSFSQPEEWSGHVAYLLDPLKLPVDTTIADSLRVIPKESNPDNGFTMVLRELKTAKQDTFKYILDYKFSKHGNQVVFQSSGDSTFLAGIYKFDCNISELKPGIYK